MWIVRLALRRPYTFTVMAILIVLMGIVTITRMATDIFPKIDIPVVSVIWSFPGVAPEEMEKRFVTVTERAMTTTVNDIEHIESQSYNGVSVIKVFFHEGAKVEAGVAQVTSITQTLLRILPPGTTPPLILQYSASNVPILQLGLTSKTLSEQDLYDLGLNFIRTQLATVQGAQVPLPYGGKSRQVMVDIDPQKLFGKGLSPADVSSALNAQNVILPAGTQKIGDREYNVRLNSSPELLQTLNDLPIRQVNNAMVYIRCRANEHRRAKSHSLGVAYGFEKRERVHPRYHQPGERGAPADQGDIAPGARHHATVRSVDLCPCRHQRCFEGGRDRGVSDGAHDSAFSRKLALHFGRRDFNSIVDLMLGHHSQRAWPNPEPDDLGWTCPRSRHFSG